MAQKRRTSKGPSRAPIQRVFVSSTASDLEDYRDKVRAALDRLGQQSVAMESFGARPNAPVDECEQLAAGADALVVIVAHRYGWIPSEAKGGDGRRSITWLEVEAAEDAGVPVFAFLVDPKAPWTAERENHRLGPDTTRKEAKAIQDAVKALHAFKAHLEGAVVRDTFASPDDLAAKVATSIGAWLLNGLPSEAVLDGYLQQLIDENARIDIRGISSSEGAGRQALSYAIEDLYTPLKTANPIQRRLEGLGEDDASGGFTPGPLDAAHHEETVTLTQLLSSHRHLLLVGAPGSGKTTFLRLITSVLARDLRDAENPDIADLRLEHLGLPLDAEPPLPVFVRLAALTHRMTSHPSHTDDDTETWLVDYLAGSHGDAIADAVVAWLDHGRGALLLDGLDEVADPKLRERLHRAVQALLRRWSDNLVVLTSRPHGHSEFADLEPLGYAEIDNFGEAEIETFVDRWVHALRSDTPMQQQAYRAELNQALIASHDIRKMARNPVMLTCLCVVHWNERRMPSGKADLLTAVLRWLLQSKPQKRADRGYTDTFAEESFKALALAMTTHPKGKQAVADLSWAAEQLARPFLEELDIEDLRTVRRKGQRFLRDEMLDSGIVERVGEGQFKFWHLTFQEHYAARAMVELGDGNKNDEPNEPENWWPLLEPHLCDRQWAEVNDHFSGCLAKTGRRRLNLLVRRILATATRGDLESTARAVGALGRALRILDVYDYSPPSRLEWERARDAAMAIFTVEGAAEVPVQERIAVAEALAEAGDPRLVDPIANLLPVPGRDGVLLGKYPVTVGEYDHFVRAGGYTDDQWWGDGWAVREAKRWTKPRGWEEQLQHTNRPVAGVSWYEAVAYCAWLAKQTAQVLRLPTEQEWFAAAWNPAGEYPWGRQLPDSERANFAPEWSSDIGHPTPVGIYPAGAAHGEHLDLAGNVWEWCLDDVTEEWVHDGEHPIRALRGGGWSDSEQSLRPGRRSLPWAEARHVAAGFRVCCSPASSSPP